MEVCAQAATTKQPIAERTEASRRREVIIDVPVSNERALASLVLPRSVMIVHWRLVFLAVLVAACGGVTLSRDAVVMKIDPRHAHVGLGSHDVSVGDAVIVRRHFCAPDPSKGKDAQTCGERVVARGTVVEVIDEQHSAIEIPSGELEEGDTVEKAK